MENRNSLEFLKEVKITCNLFLICFLLMSKYNLK